MGTNIEHQTIFRAFQVWLIQADENYKFFLGDQGGYIVPLELWEEMKEAIDNLYATTTEESRQAYNDRLDDKYKSPVIPKINKLPPKPSTVYLLQGEGTRWFKIGVTTSLKSRMKQIGVNAPFPVTIVACYDVIDSVADEREWHAKFSSKKTHGEWFELNDDDILEFITRSQQ